MNPSAMTRLAGTVDSWKRFEMGFVVSGRIVHMEDAGSEIRGEILDVSGKRLTEGTVIAKLDDKRYRIALDEQKALLASAQAKVEAARVELEAAIPEKLKAAQADLMLQEQEVERYTKMVAENSAPQERLDQIRTAYKVAQANVAEVEALIATKTAGLEALRAQVKVAEEMVAQARINLEDCTLIAPFTGQIARVHAITGAEVLRSQPVATVQMMDPIKVQVAVSPRLDAQINYNDFARVHLPDSDEVLNGYVYLKDTFADPVTRTYLVTLLTRNPRIEVGPVATVEDRSAPRATELLQLQKRDPTGPGPYFVEIGSLYEDGEGFYVWKAEGFTRENRRKDKSQRYKARKVRVTPGEELFDLQQLFTFRALDDPGELDPDRDFIFRGVTGDVRDGEEVLVVHNRWLLRPGDVVRVELGDTELEPGLYVPEEAIQFDGQRHAVYVVKSQDSESEIAAQVEVRVDETVGPLQRIEPVTEGQLTEGMRLVVAGAHYIAEGERINPVEEVELTP
jgi:multidrug efflux pump subunit AcrA (membrane-fusion protein)